MASYLWSWIFIIIQLMLVRPGYAHVSRPNYEVLARRALRNVFARSLSAEERSRNTFTALAIAAGVVLLVLLFGLFLVIRRRRQQKVPELEAGVATAKPSWWMVDGKNEKIDWRLSHRTPAIPPVESQPERRPQSGDQSRIERLKAALQIQKKGGMSESILPTHRKMTNSPTETIILPLQTNPNMEPRYPDILERGYQVPIYPAQSPPQITTTFYGSDNKPLQRTPSIPPQAIVTQGQRATLSRSGARSGAPRSPAGHRRRDWLSRNSFRHPFLPLKHSDAPLATKISAPVPITIDTTNPKLGYALNLSNPRAAPSPPAGPRSSFKPPVPPKLTRKSPPPAPLELRGEALLSGRKVRFGLPSSPRPSRNNASPLV
ncbi:hypothetical protein M413DRAFT_440909 [Hebeloma cylindrosporum]|uniref:Uncharacterized protein n=1 Tax=Hebeloma cylindrosporum TaxID=76867 RepID=A0A0C3CPR6_HEBCY|nr:hypothetical protein M413DRAFT_440909 [Hebeloma cylindrosporum h7]